MNELIACSDYDDGICRPTGDVCPLQIEDHPRCTIKYPQETSDEGPIPTEERDWIPPDDVF